MKHSLQLPAATMDRLALLGACLLALVIVLKPVFDWDLYWHLANGREMVQQGRIISEEVFSYTHYGEKFDNHEWLAQIIFYLVWLSMGAYGLLAMKLLTTVLVVLFCYKTARIWGAAPWLSGLISVFAILAGYLRYTERPELFTLLFFSFLGYLLYAYRAGQASRRWLWLIPPLFVAWNSLHGAVYGLALLGLFVTGENIKHFLPAARRDPADGRMPIRPLNICLAVTLLAMLADPLGLRSYDIFFSLVQNQGELTSTIAEFLPLSWLDPFKPFILFLAAAILLALRHIRRADVTHLLLLVFFGGIAVRYSRAIGIAAIAMVPLFAHLMTITVRQAAGNKLKNFLVITPVIAAIGLACDYSYKLKFANESLHKIGYRLDEVYLPAGAVRFVQKVGLTGNYFNTGHFGGYMSYFLAPGRRIFQYNLPTIFGNPYRFTKNPSELEQWDINYAILGSPNEISLVFPSAQWARIYRDPGGVLVLRRTPQNEALIQRYELHFFHPLMTDDALRELAHTPGALPRLSEEMGTYLSFRADERIANLWAEMLAANPELKESQHGRELLQEALEYNRASKLAGIT